MSRDGPAELAERKALLVTRAHLDRARMLLAVHEIRARLRPVADPLRRAQVRPTAAMILGFAVPLLGLNRVARLVRFLSFGLTAYHIARNWQERRY